MIAIGLIELQRFKKILQGLLVPPLIFINPADFSICKSDLSMIMQLTIGLNGQFKVFMGAVGTASSFEDLSNVFICLRCAKIMPGFGRKYGCFPKGGKCHTVSQVFKVDFSNLV